MKNIKSLERQQNNLFQAGISSDLMKLIPDPTSAAKNNTRKKKSEKRLTMWAASTNRLLITGHTHHPMIGTLSSPYCNTGSCVHPGSITCIEIENRCLTLIKWSMQAGNDMALYVKREKLGETVCVDEYCTK